MQNTLRSVDATASPLAWSTFFFFPFNCAASSPLIIAEFSPQDLSGCKGPSSLHSARPHRHSSAGRKHIPIGLLMREPAGPDSPRSITPAPFALHGFSFGFSFSLGAGQWQLDVGAAHVAEYLSVSVSVSPVLVLNSLPQVKGQRPGKV